VQAQHTRHTSKLKFKMFQHLSKKSVLVKASSLHSLKRSFGYRQACAGAFSRSRYDLWMALRTWEQALHLRQKARWDITMTHTTTTRSHSATPLPVPSSLPAPLVPFHVIQGSTATPLPFRPEGRYMIDANALIEDLPPVDRDLCPTSSLRCRDTARQCHVQRPGQYHWPLQKPSGP